MSELSPHTIALRTRLQPFINRVLAAEAAVVGFVVIGSVANGSGGPDSDIDAVAFLHPFDPYILPAEALWDPRDDTFHAIFTTDPVRQKHGLPLDILRLDWQTWSAPAHVWPPQRCAELHYGWLAYDPTGAVAALIAARTVYDEKTRQNELDTAITWLDQHLNWGAPAEKWARFGPLVAHDRLQAAFSYLVGAIFALNGRHRPWRNRQMKELLQLPWLPTDDEQLLLTAANAPGLDFAGYDRRFTALQTQFAAIRERAKQTGLYSEDPISEAFIRTHEEPGRAWNMHEWTKHRQARRRPLLNE